MRSSFSESPLLPRRGGFEPTPPFGGAETRTPAPDAAEAQEREREAAAREALRAEIAAENRERIDAALGALDRAAGLWRRIEAREMDAVCGGVVELALALARRVLEREIAADPAALLAPVKQALEALAAPVGARIVLAPDDLAAIEANADEALARVAERWSATVASDATLAAGEARVEAGASCVDLRLDAVLECFREALLAPDASQSSDAPDAPTEDER